jgi:hypothetical protein
MSIKETRCGRGGVAFGGTVITLLRSQTSTLLAQPESGMGYQTVEVEIPTGTRRATVYNADLLFWEEAPSAHLATSVYERLAGTARDVEARMIRSIRVVPRELDVSSSSTMRRLALTASSGPAVDGEARGTAPGDVFMRFTAYSNDRRITPGKGLLPGTYATTEEDSRAVVTGGQAVERYALPNPTPAVYRFRIDPTAGTQHQVGIVQPAYGRAGGGVEVLFTIGTARDTVGGPAVLPEA